MDWIDIHHPWRQNHKIIPFGVLCIVGQIIEIEHKQSDLQQKRKIQSGRNERIYYGCVSVYCVVKFIYISASGPSSVVKYVRRHTRRTRNLNRCVNSYTKKARNTKKKRHKRGVRETNIEEKIKTAAMMKTMTMMTIVRNHSIHFQWNRVVLLITYDIYIRNIGGIYRYISYFYDGTRATFPIIVSDMAYHVIDSTRRTVCSRRYEYDNELLFSLIHFLHHSTHVYGPFFSLCFARLYACERTAMSYYK